MDYVFILFSVMKIWKCFKRLIWGKSTNAKFIKNNLSNIINCIFSIRSNNLKFFGWIISFSKTFLDFDTKKTSFWIFFVNLFWKIVFPCPIFKISYNQSNMATTVDYLSIIKFINITTTKHKIYKLNAETFYLM